VVADTVYLSKIVGLFWCNRCPPISWQIDVVYYFTRRR